MISSKDSLRNDKNYTYHDSIFANEINQLIQVADEAYEKMIFREAVKASFYDLQTARDRYREIGTVGEGMNWQLVERFIQVKKEVLHSKGKGREYL